MANQGRVKSQNCPICLENFKQPRKLPTCKHVFCETCISDSLVKLTTRSENENERGFSCPVCRVVNQCPRNSEDLLTWISTLEIAEKAEVVLQMENMEVCMPCKKLNNTTRAVKYCIDCRESLCAQCFEETQKFRGLQEHIVVEINGDKDPCHKENEWGMNQTLAEYLACKQHPDKNVSFVCEYHNELCCQTCVITNHRKCDKVTELQHQILKGESEQEVSRLEESINDLIKHCQKVIEDIRGNESANKTAADKIDQTLTNMRTKANQLFDMLEQNISQESKALLKKYFLSNETIILKVEDIIDKLKFSSTLLENTKERANRTMGYVVRRRILDLLSEFETKLFEVTHNTKMFGFELKPESTLSDFIDLDINETTRLVTLKETDSMIDLTKHTGRYCKITKTGTYSIIAGNSPGKYPNYSDLVYTPENKLLLVDSNYGFANLVSDTYTLLASCNCTILNTGKEDPSKKPFSSTYLDKNLVAATVPKRNKLVILNAADRKLKIQTELETLHTPKAVCGLNNGDLAVSWAEPVAFGIVTFRYCQLEEKSYFDRDKLGRVLKSFDYMAVDQMKSHVIQPCIVDKAVFCFDFQGNPKFEYRHADLQQPAGLGIDASGNIYVCDSENACIHILSSSGIPIRIHKEGCPEKPMALAFDIVGTTFAVTRGYSDYFDTKRREIHVYRLSD